MAEFKVRNTNTGNEYYFVTDEIDLQPTNLRGELVAYADRSKELHVDEMDYRAKIGGVWEVPPSRSHPSATPKSAEDIWAMALTEALAGRAIEVYPTITEGTEGGLQPDGLYSAGSTSIGVIDGAGGGSFEVKKGAVIEFDHNDLYVVQQGASGTSGTIRIAEPGLTTDLNSSTMTLYEGYPLSVFPDPESPPQFYDTQKGSNQLVRELTFESDSTYTGDAHIWDVLSDLTDAL